MSKLTALVLESLLADCGSYCAIILEVLGLNKDGTQYIHHDGLTKFFFGS